MVSSNFFLGILSLCLSCLQLSLATYSGYQIVEHLDATPQGWTNTGTPAAAKLMRFHLAVYQERAAEFEQKVLDLATPGHDSYGKHMKREEVKEFLRPSDDVAEKVLAWLKSEDVPGDAIENDGHCIKFTVPILQAERMLKTRFYHYHNEETDATAIRTLEYSVPRGIHPYIQLIQPTTRFGNLGPQRTLPSVAAISATFEDLTADCSKTITPDCLRELYGLYDTKATPDRRNTLGVSGYLNQYARYGDFQKFLDTYAPNSTDANFTVVSINGGRNEQDSSAGSTEASLDIQYAIAMAYNTPATFYTTGGVGPLAPDADQPDANSSTNEPYLDQLHYLLNLPDDELPAVLSTSYGESEQSVPESYANVTCSMFAQLGARGVSVIFSSGDAGVGTSCLMNDGTNRTRFLPSFPASCPFVTSVGGTYGIKPEKAISFSGGGFSERFSRPPYQEQAVGNYLQQLGNQWDGLYNPHGRGIPDVSAQAVSFLIVDHGGIRKIGGTSASAPVFAGIISQLNSARLARDLPRLGFLNPWLYSLNQTGFTDIVEGGSTGCTGFADSGLKTPEVSYASWNATPGWDPVTGLGTPFFHTLIKLVESA